MSLTFSQSVCFPVTHTASPLRGFLRKACPVRRHPPPPCFPPDLLELYQVTTWWHGQPSWLWTHNRPPLGVQLWRYLCDFEWVTLFIFILSRFLSWKKYSITSSTAGRKKNVCKTVTPDFPHSRVGQDSSPRCLAHLLRKMLW